MRKKIVFIILAVSLLIMSSYAMAIKLDTPPGLSKDKNENAPGHWKKNTEFESKNDFINEIHNNILIKLELNEVFPSGLIEPIEETAPPIAIITWSTPVLAGRPVTVYAGDSYDPDGGEIVVIEWDIDGNLIFDNMFNNIDTIFPVYDDPGEFLIGLIVTDDEGQITELYETIIVEA